MTDRELMQQALEALGEGALHLIQQVLRKHDAAVIEASIEAIEATKAKDEALLRRALDALDRLSDSNQVTFEDLELIAALRERLGDEE